MTEKILKDLASLRKNSKELVPSLVEFYRGTYSSEPLVLQTLIAIEADPKDVIPLVKDFLQVHGGFSGRGQLVDERQCKTLEDYLTTHTEKTSKR